MEICFPISLDSYKVDENSKLINEKWMTGGARDILVAWGGAPLHSLLIHSLIKYIYILILLKIMKIKGKINSNIEFPF